MDMKNMVANRTSLLVVAGSHAYGTNTETSDIDVRGICVAPLSVRLSAYNCFEQYEGEWPWDGLPLGWNHERQKSLGDVPDDIVIYDIAKAVKLMGDCNPNMLELLFCDQEDVLFSTAYGDMLRADKHLFVSLKIKFTYVGYARSQLARIKRHRGYLMGGVPEKPTRKGYGLPESGGLLDHRESNLINEEIKARLLEWGIEDFEMTPAERDVLRERMREFSSHALRCSTDDLEGRLEDVAAMSLGLTSEVREALDRERKFRAAMKGFKSYVKWKEERNPKRKELEEKYGFDTKHASHLIRLARTGVEVLTDGNILVRRPDADELKAIRLGSRSFESIQDEAEELEKKMDSLYKENPAGLPKKVDTARLDCIVREHVLMNLS